MTPLSPRTLQLVGVCILFASATFWMITGRQSVEFVSAAMTLITLGSFWNAQLTTSHHPEYEVPPKPEPEEPDPPS